MPLTIRFADEADSWTSKSVGSAVPKKGCDSSVGLTWAQGKANSFVVLVY